MNILLHTPEGVRDLYNSDCEKKLWIEDRINAIIRSYGYHNIEAPTFEYFDIFNKERGSVASKEMYKFFDREGNTLVLRPDMTPQIARIAAKYYENEPAPIKLCYKGRKYINSSSYQGRLKETTEIGAELIGDASVDSDAEVIVMLAKSLLSAGLTEFQVEIGQINYFRGLVEEAGLNSDAENEMLEMIKNKNYFGIEELIGSYKIDKNVGEAFLKLPQMFGSVEILDEALKLTENKTACDAIMHLKELHLILKEYGLEKYVSYDLGMLNKLRYYTGVMFQAFTYGTGEYIASGGRYDRLIKQFGADKPSIGFCITVDYLLIAIDRQKIKLDTDTCQTFALVFEPEERTNAIKLSTLYRSKGINVNMLSSDPSHSEDYYIDYAKRNHSSHLIFVKSNDTVKMIHTATGNVREEAISNIFE